MRPLAIVIGCLALAMTASAPAATPSTSVRVPRVVGWTESRAQCQLASAGLRWRFRGDGRVRSRPIISCSGTAAVNPDAKIISQLPRAGTRVTRRTVIVLDDECLRRLREHHSACA
jgi:beta-lactam-binding protein with PASTA domain